MAESTKDKLARAIRSADACTTRINSCTLTPQDKEIWEDSRREHLRDTARLQKRLDKEVANA